MSEIKIKKHRVRFKHLKKVKPLKRILFGYSSKRKFIRKFNNKEYIRVGQYKIKSVAEEIKNRYHKQGKLALLIPSGKNYQIWLRNKED